MNRADIIPAIVSLYPAVIKHLKGRAALMYCETKAVERDPDEPGREEKTTIETQLTKAVRARFKRQLAEIQRKLEERYPNKSIIIDGIVIEDSDEEYAEFIKIFYNALLSGTLLSEDMMGFALADGSVNERALSYARTYVTEWLQILDQVSRDAVRRALETFIQPGGTIQDMVDILEPQFGDMRAQRIAVTETTRIFAQANNIYAEELRLQYPEFDVNIMWFTNRDDRVCSICGPLEGRTVRPGEVFTLDIKEPPAHVNCRCWTNVTVKA